MRAGLKGDFATAKDIHYRFMDLVDLLFVDGNPAGIKKTLSCLGICGQEVRLPLVPATAATQKAIERKVETLREIATV